MFAGFPNGYKPTEILNVYTSHLVWAVREFAVLLANRHTTVTARPVLPTWQFDMLIKPMKNTMFVRKPFSHKVILIGKDERTSFTWWWKSGAKKFKRPQTHQPMITRHPPSIVETYGNACISIGFDGVTLNGRPPIWRFARSTVNYRTAHTKCDV